MSTLVRRARVLAIVGASLLRALPSGDARAAEPVAAAPGSEADRLFEEGVVAQKAGKLAEAEALFLKAWAQKKTWDIAANLGLVQLKQGKLPEGADHVAYARANLPPTESDTTRESLTRALDAARPSLTEVTLRCDVDGAEVRAGGRSIGTTPLARSFFVAPGAVTIEVTKDGYEPASKALDATKGGVEAVTLSPVRKAAPERSKVPAIVLGGVGVASLIAGGVVLGVSFAAKGDIEKKSNDIRSGKIGCPADPRCADLEAQAKSGDVMNRTGVGLLVGGVVLGAAAGAFALWPSAPSKQGALRVMPTASSDVAGVLVSGSF